MKIIYIDGLWFPGKTPFYNKKCVVGKHKIKMDSDEDCSIFYYFDNEEELKASFKEGRLCDFVVTAVRNVCHICEDTFAKPRWTCPACKDDAKDENKRKKEIATLNLAKIRFDKWKAVQE